MDIQLKPLTHVDVEQQTFHASFRGYAEDEVDQFLDDVVFSLKTLHEMVNDRDNRIVALSGGEGGEPDQAVAGALIEAQRTADRIVAEARAEASDISAESVPVISDEQAAQYEADLERHETLKHRLAELQSQLNTIAGAATAAAGGAVVAAASNDVEAEQPVPEPEPEVEAAPEPPMAAEPEVHNEPEIGLVGFVDPVSLVDEPIAEAVEPTLYEIPAAIQQADVAHEGTRLSQILRQEPHAPQAEAPEPAEAAETVETVGSDAAAELVEEVEAMDADVEEVAIDAVEDLAEEASEDTLRRPWERG